MSVNSDRKINKHDEDVDSYLTKVGLRNWTLILTIFYCLCYSTTGSLIYTMSISTYIPTRTCTSLVTNESIFVNSGDDKAYDYYCRNYRYSKEWNCVNNETAIFNITSRFNLECTDGMKWSFSALGSVYNFMMILGSLVIGVLLDKYGRKNVLAAGGFLLAFSMLCAWYATDYSTFLVFFGLMGMSAEFFYLPAYILAAEIVSKDQVANVGTYMMVVDGLNCVFSIWIYRYLANVNYFILYLAIRVIISALFVIFFCTESPWFLYLNNRIAECNTVLYELGMANGMDSLPMVEAQEVDNNSDGEADAANIMTTEWNFCLYINILLYGLLWFCLILLFFYMYYYAKYFPGDVYTSLTIEASAGIVAYITSLVFLYWLGNKRTVVLSLGIIIVVAIFWEEIEYNQITLFMGIFLNIFMVSLAFNVLYIMTASYFYDDIKGKVFGLVNVMGRIGGILAPSMSEFISLKTMTIVGALLAVTLTILVRRQKYTDSRWLSDIKNQYGYVPTYSIIKNSNKWDMMEEERFKNDEMKDMSEVLIKKNGGNGKKDVIAMKGETMDNKEFKSKV